MPFNFNFHSIESMSDVRAAIDFLHKQDLGYPNYGDWVQRAESELSLGYKQGIIATSGSRVVGDVVWQPHKQLSRVREIKNIRVHPDIRGRRFAHFMLRQAEVEQAGNYDLLMCDAREDQTEIIDLMTFLGYTSLFSQNLYDPNKKDVVMVKCLDTRFQDQELRRIMNGFGQS